MKIVTIVGARPQFIKASAISRDIADNYKNDIQEVIVHTGQHFDDNMSKIFFDELDIPEPKYNLEISGGGHGQMTGRMLEAIEIVLLKEKPNVLLIYGDTNSTLAGALAASKINIPIAHVEAGLRSFNMHMPEEVNRIVADRLSRYLFCPTTTSVKNLTNEGITQGVHLVGDVMYDVSLFYREIAKQKSNILKNLDIADKSFVLATCHRAENTDDPKRLKAIYQALHNISSEVKVVFPIHPRTRALLYKHKLLKDSNNLILVDPLPFLDMIRVEQAALAIVTDSGGVQKEAFFYGVPCITVRGETEWVETVEAGWNTLVDADVDLIVSAFKNIDSNDKIIICPYGEGDAAHRCLQCLVSADWAN